MAETNTTLYNILQIQINFVKKRKKNIAISFWICFLEQWKLKKKKEVGRRVKVKETDVRTKEEARGMCCEDRGRTTAKEDKKSLNLKIKRGGRFSPGASRRNQSGQHLDFGPVKLTLGF